MKLDIEHLDEISFSFLSTNVIEDIPYNKELIWNEIQETGNKFKISEYGVEQTTNPHTFRIFFKLKAIK